ncbi:MAG: D-aminoacyl-tRNA deacylase [Aerococcaceae bacterium]|nr:D-aminoacyl-tRNA deacylase [Aerococcaceae bacterium]
MKVVIQRALESSVSIAGHIVAQIDKGYVLLVGITHDDTLDDVQYCVRKISQMRLFEDSAGKMNLDLNQVGGQILSVSQFTLYANTTKGNRPSFIEAARPEQAEFLYNQFNELLRQAGFEVVTGQFGANMQVSLVNDGPVTILLESKH